MAFAPAELQGLGLGSHGSRLGQVLHGRVIGQNEAVTAVAKAVRRARAGLHLVSALPRYWR